MISRAVCTIFALCERVFSTPAPAAPPARVDRTPVVRTEKLTAMHRRAQAAEGREAKARGRIERLVKVVDEARESEREAREALANDEASKQLVYAEKTADEAKAYATEVRAEVIRRIQKIATLEAELKTARENTAAETARWRQAESILEELRGIIGNVTEGTPAQLRQLLAGQAAREDAWDKERTELVARALKYQDERREARGRLHEIARLSRRVMANTSSTPDHVALRAALESYEAIK